MILRCVHYLFMFFCNFLFIFIPIQIINKKHLIKKNELNITSRDSQIEKGQAGGALQEGARKNA